MPRKLPLLTPEYAPIHLDRFWIERLEYTEVPDREDDLWVPDIRMSRPQVLQAGGGYLVTVRVHVAQMDVRSIDMTVVGSFDIDPEYFADSQDSSQDPLRMVAHNGAAMLFSAARGVIEAVTGLSGYGRMHVTSVNVAELLSR